MKKFILFIFLGLHLTCIGATNDLLIYQYQNISGKNYKTNEMILANEFVFADRIEQYYLDTISNSIFLQLCGTSKNGKWLNDSGSFLAFDLKADSIRWDKQISYTGTTILQSNDVIVGTSDLGSIFINPVNGIIQTRTKNSVHFIAPQLKIGIGYAINNEGNPNKLVGIELLNGKLRWNREISHEYDWNEEMMLNDSVLMLVSDGLHFINLKNGDGWDFKAKTGRNDYTGTIVTNVLGIAIGILTGVLITSTGHDVITNLTSNAVCDSSGIYYASRENISRFDLDGNIKWTTKLEKNNVSNSTLFIQDSILYMTNKGIALMENRPINFGKSFFSAYNKQTGKPIFYSLLNGNKTQINDSEMNKDTMVFALKNRILKYSMLTGENLADKSFGIETIGEFYAFAGKNLYLKSDSSFQNLRSDSGFYYLKTLNNKLLELTNGLEISRLIDMENVYTGYLSLGNLRFLANEDQTFVINNDNKIVADIKASSKAKLIGNKLIDVHENSVIETDLSGVLKFYQP
ncbi:MAG: hypothetical protein WC542_06300 [Paludibacter sp.]